jgi:lysophospholipase L1-like esterase
MPNFRRLLLTTIVLAPIVLLGLIGCFWVDSQLPRWAYWQLELIALIAGEIAYAALLILAAAGAIGFGLLLWKGKGTRPSRRRSVRGLLLCVTLLFASLVSEATSGYWQFLRRRATAIPVGGLRDARGRVPSDGEIHPGWGMQLSREFPEDGNDSDIDILILGESSAEGVPYEQWISIGRILEWQIEEVLPRRQVRLRTLAGSGSTLELQHKALVGLRRRPDIMVIYCGHNEISARLLLSRDLPYYLDDQLPSAWGLAVQQLERTSPLCGLIRETADKCRLAIPPPANGYRDLIDSPVYTVPEFRTLLNDFRRRLEAIVSYAESVGAQVVLVAPPANDAGFEPSRSFLPPTTPRSARSAFRRDFLSARRQETSSPEEAIAAYRALLARQPGFAETHFRLARLLERAGRWDEAYEHYVAARDQDGYPMRMVTQFQDIYREAARRHGCMLVDGQAYFHAIGRHGLLDDHLFHDGLHPSLRGQIALAQEILRQLKERRALGWPEPIAAPIIDPVRCARKFGVGLEAWEYVCRWGIMFYDITIRMRYEPSERRRRRQAFADAAVRIQAGDPPESVGLPNIGISSGPP